MQLICPAQRRFGAFSHGVGLIDLTIATAKLWLGRTCLFPAAPQRSTHASQHACRTHLRLSARFYDGSASWDEFASSTRTAIHKTKAVVSFNPYRAAELGSIAQIIHDKMLLNALTFTKPTVTMVDLQTLVTTYDQKLLARASRAKADVIAFIEAREALHDALTRLGNYVNSVALGDASVVEKSGFPSYSTERAPDENPPTAPTHLRLKQGELSGSFLARYKPSRRNSSNELQTCTGDPNNEADWYTKGIFLGSRADLEGFTPGTVVWVRVRTVGRKGVMGSWSDPAQIRVV